MRKKPAGAPSSIDKCDYPSFMDNCFSRYATSMDYEEYFTCAHNSGCSVYAKKTAELAHL